MLSHWYNHDNVGNNIKGKSLTNIQKLDTQNFLKVPDISVTTSFLVPSQYTISSNSINSNKGSNSNLRDGHPNFRAPWKIVVIGDAGVGKTSIIKQFLTGYFNNNYNPTVEDSYLHHITLPDGLNQCIEILDTSGFYQFPAMRELNIRLGTAFVLVFDLTKTETFKNLVDLRQFIFNIKGTENIPIVIVGNKSDLVIEKNISLKNDIENLRSTYIETSAKENLNVSFVFKKVVELILKEIEELREAMNLANNISRRNSSISFVRRISTNNLLNLRTDQARRFSMPACPEAIQEKNDQKKKETLTPTRRKQKNCIIC